jgi:hypothetical protein
MRTVTSLVLLASLCLLPACGDKADAAIGDIGKQTAAIEKVKTTLADVTKSLNGITDAATAEKAKTTLDGLATALKTQMADLGSLGKLSDALGTTKDSLVKGVQDQIAKLAGNAEIQKAIGPVLDKLKAALGA